MIEKMLKITVICRNLDKKSTLKSLRNIGIMHINSLHDFNDSKITDIQSKINRIKTLSSYLNSVSEKNIAVPHFHHHHYLDDAKTPEKLTEVGLKHLEANSELGKKIDDINRDIDLLRPWGNFDSSTLDNLAENGVYAYLCYLSTEQYKKYNCDDSIKKEISRKEQYVYFAQISNTKLDINQLPLAKLPDSKLSIIELENLKKQHLEEIEHNNHLLKTISANKDIVNHHSLETEEQLEFQTNLTTMSDQGELAYIVGYIPKKQLNNLLNMAKHIGWAVLTSEPKSDDKTPTLITVPKIFNIAKPIFDFIGIAPAYKEWDVSVCFLIFFAIFFAMIIGDAGYGILFLIAGMYMKVAMKKKTRVQPAINLFIILSIVTIIWGVMTCQFFGIPQNVLPKSLQGFRFLTDPSIKDQNVQYICFMLAAIHLSLARIWKAILYRNSFKSLGQIGWAMFIWGNFFLAIKLIVFPQIMFPQFAFYLYGIGIVLIMLFHVHWKDVGSIFQFPFGVISSFVDVLSYIRLFAVGIAGYYIAVNFNYMSMSVLKISPYLALFAILILIFGHLLNIALSLMGVLVHGIRLNTLEFSNHMELEWGGIEYKPFKRKINEEESIS